MNIRRTPSSLQGVSPRATEAEMAKTPKTIATRFMGPHFPAKAPRCSCYRRRKFGGPPPMLLAKQACGQNPRTPAGTMGYAG